MVQVNMIPFHGEKRKTQQPNQHEQATKPHRNKTKENKNTTRTKTSRSGMTYPKATMKRNDQATYVPGPEQVILEATAQSQTLTDDREAPSKKSRSAETQDPPSQDPGDRITKPCRHNKHQCTSIASICRAV